jgi:hypothetical protein
MEWYVLKGDAVIKKLLQAALITFLLYLAAGAGWQPARLDSVNLNLRRISGWVSIPAN